MKFLYFLAGLLIFLVVQVLMFMRIEPVTTYFFVFIWWSYIILVDSFILWRKGSSLFSRLKNKVFFLVFCSFCFWGFFEILNRRIANWYYLNLAILPVSPLGLAVFALFAFGSVLPGILETHELLQFCGLSRCLKFLRWDESAKFLKWKWWGCPKPLWIIIGILMIIVSLIWPTYFFWMIWIALIFVFDPLVERADTRSILSELREGKVHTFYRLLLTGLVCGILWESWNYRAGLKWVYEVPFVNGWKIFEMPILGYLGFQFFAVECYVFYRWLECRFK